MRLSSSSLQAVDGTAVTGHIASMPDTTGSLQREIKQPKAFRSREAEAFLNVLRTSAALVGDLAELLRGYELTQPQYNVLRILRGAGEAGLARGEVGDRMVAREPDVTRLIDRMEQRGLLTRSREGQDRRVVRVRITPQGLSLVNQLDEPVQHMHERQLGHLSETELASLCDLLAKARDGGVVRR
jgi:DNA-binding MarR family transcriptional regulator